MEESRQIKQVTRGAATVGIATLASRALGFVRDVVLAYFFGAASTTDAFFVAFRIPNVFRRFVGEGRGAFVSVFIPILAESIEKHGKDKAKEFYKTTLGWFGLVVLIISILGIIFSSALITVFSPGFKADASQFELAVMLNRIMFPYLFFISLYALFMGVLNTLGHFFAPAIAPTLLNLCLILAAIISPYFKQPIAILAISVTVSGFLQFLLQLPYLKTKGFLLAPKFSGLTAQHKQLLKLMIPSFLGFLVYTVNTMITPAIGSLLGSGAISYLYYADRLIELPMAVIGLAFATAILPALSHAIAKSDDAEFSSTLILSMRRLLFVSIPAAIGLIALAEPIVKILFERGEFSAEDTAGTSSALVAYAIGLVAFTVVQVLLRAFYAQKDLWTPLASEVVAMASFVIFSALLVGPLKSQSMPTLNAIFTKLSVASLSHVGIALAFSISAYIQIAFLQILLAKRVRLAQLRSIFLPTLKMLVASTVMGLVLCFVAKPIFAHPKAPLWTQAIALCALILLGMVIYEALLLVFKEEEARFLWNKIYGGFFSWKKGV